MFKSRLLNSFELHYIFNIILNKVRFACVILLRFHARNFTLVKYVCTFLWLLLIILLQKHAKFSLKSYFKKIYLSGSSNLSLNTFSIVLLQWQILTLYSIFILIRRKFLKGLCVFLKLTMYH